MKRLILPFLAFLLVIIFSPAFAQDRIYWGDQTLDRIGSVLASNLTSATVPVPSATNPSGIAYYHANPAFPLFYAGTSELLKDNLAAAGSSQLLSTTGQFNRGVVVDYINKKIYWANDQGSIGRADIDGTNKNEFFITGVPNPWDVEIDHVNGKIYWTEDIGTGGNVRRANLSDGSGVETLVSDIDGGALGVAVDPLRGGKLFYTAFPSGAIFSANLDGTGAVQLSGISAYADIDVDYITGRIYAVSYGPTNTLTKANSDGSSPTVVTADGIFIEYADVTTPTITAINRQNPSVTGQAFVGGTAVFRVLFSEPMLNVDLTDFVLAPGSTTGTLSLSPVGTARTLWDVTVSNIGPAGTLNLDVAASHNLIDFRGNPFAGTVAGDLTYTVIAQPSPTVTSFNPPSGDIGVEVIITGTNFSTTPANNSVTFNGVPGFVTASTATTVTTNVPDGATDGPIAVTFGGLTGVSSTNFDVTCTPPPVPTITRVLHELSSSSATGNQWIKDGSDISGATNPTYIVTAPGAYRVRVTELGCPSESSVLTLTAGDLTPNITSFTPTLGPVVTVVIISGTNFHTTPANNTVTFNGVAAVVSSSSSISITTNVPAGATSGAIAVTVGGFTGTSSGSFTVTGVTPTVTSFSPTSGPSGTTVTITGTNFSPTSGTNTVTFNGVAATVTASTTTSITTTVPSTGTTGPIAVTVGGLTGTSSTNFTVSPAITSFSPTFGVVGTIVTISGRNFSATPASNTVTFNGVAATVTASTTTSITTTVPATATTGAIAVTVGSLTGTSGSNFMVTGGATPTVTSFTPGSGPIGTTVTITGTNFSATPGSNTVTFNGVAATVTASTTTSITTTVPATATTGLIAVTVGGLTGTSTTNFTVTAAGTPSITSFSPTSGPVGTTVTITGTNFSATPGNNAVTFNGIAATVTASTTTSITTSVPATATTGVIGVTVGGLTGTSSTNFTVLPPSTPAIGSFSPTSGPVGTTVTITGTNFSATPGNNTVTFNGVAATVTASTTSTITTSVPATATTGPIAITVGGLTGTSSTNFTVTAAATPTVTSFAPTSGPVGTTVTITGTNFSATPASNTVRFNGITATVTASTTTSITTTVPATATTGTVSVTVGGLTGTSTTNFTVTAGTPSITSFSPASGQVGTLVTITGTNFSATPASNTVRFNGITAAVTASSTTSITAIVPATATTGTISVIVGGLTGTSATNFTVTGGGTPPTVTSFAPILGPVGTTVIITGTNFSATPASNTVRFNGVASTVAASTTTSITTTVPATATTGVVSVTVGGLTGASATNFTVTCTPPPKPTITTEGGLLTSSSATGNQWLLNGTEIAGATTQTYTATEAGAYTVRVTVGACSSQSDATTITGYEGNISTILKVYPNPADAKVRIELVSHLPAGKAEVFTMTGTRRDGIVLTPEAGKLVGELDVKMYATGLYIVIVSTEQSIQVVKLKKQ